MPTKLTKEIFINKANNIHKSFYDYSKVIYINNSSKIVITCPLHGDFNQIPREHLDGSGCFLCSLDKKSVKQRMTLNDFLEKANFKHNYVYDYSMVNFKNSKTKIKIICPIHGVFEQTVTHHLSGYGCKICGNIKSNKNRMNTNLFIEKANDIHNNIYNYSFVNYIDARTPIKIVCKKHDVFYQRPNDHLNSHGCPKCNKVISNMETKWLDYIGLPNDNNHRNVTIKLSDGKRYKVDGYCEKTNTIYEFYGDFWHGNPNIYSTNLYCKVTKKTFGEMFSNTIIKEDRIKNAGFKLITMWEHEWKKYLEKL